MLLDCTVHKLKDWSSIVSKLRMILLIGDVQINHICASENGFVDEFNMIYVAITRKGAITDVS